MPRRILLALVWLLPALPVLAAAPPPGPVALDRALDHAIALHQAGRLPEALREYHAVAAAGAADPAIGAAALSNACVIQNDHGDYRAALPDCRRALAQSRLLGDAETLGRALNNLGLALEALGETAEAEARFREALVVNRRTGNAESEAVNLSNLGTLAVATGRYTPAMNLQAQAAALALRHAREPWAAEQLRIARINQGVVLDKEGAYREALELYRQVLAAGGELDAARRAALEVHAGVIYRNLGDPVRAIELFRAAIAGYRGAGDSAGLSNAHLNLALALHLNLERTAEAEAAYREALRLAEASGDRTEEIQDLFYLGRLLLGQRRLPEAGGGVPALPGGGDGERLGRGEVVGPRGAGPCRPRSRRPPRRPGQASRPALAGEIERQPGRALRSGGGRRRPATSATSGRSTQRPSKRSPSWRAGSREAAGGAGVRDRPGAPRRKRGPARTAARRRRRLAAPGGGRPAAAPLDAAALRAPG